MRARSLTRIQAAALLIGLMLAAAIPLGMVSSSSSTGVDAEPWDPRGPYVNELVLRTRSPQDWRRSIVEQEVDYVVEPWHDDVQLQEFLDHWSNIRVNWSDSFCFESLGFNCLRYPYNFPAFRRALALATDKAQFALSMWGAGRGHPLDTMTPPTYGVWHNSQTTPKYTNAYVSAAQAELAAAGFLDIDSDGYVEAPNGQNFVFRPFYLTEEAGRWEAAFASQEPYWDAAGIPISPMAVSRTTLFDLIFNIPRNFDGAFLSWNYGRLPLYYQYWTTAEIGHTDGNWLNWANTTYDTLAATQMHAQSFTAVLNATLRLQQVLVDQLPIIALCWHAEPYVYRDNRLQGWFSSPGIGMGLSNHWLPRKVRLQDSQPDRNSQLGTGGTLRVGVSTTITCTNPLRDLTRYDELVLSLIYDTLIGEPDPRDHSVTTHSGLAYRWTVEEVETGLKYVFTITDQAMWHDGQPVTAEDVEFSYRYIAVERPLRYWRMTPYLNSCRALDDTSVELVTNGRSYWSLDLVGNWVILPKHHWETIADSYHYANSEPIGCGPFKWNQSSAGDVQLLAWENYHYRVTQETPPPTLPWGLLIPIGVGSILVAGVSATIWHRKRSTRKLTKGQKTFAAPTSHRPATLSQAIWLSPSGYAPCPDCPSP